ncbi:MAG TPA: hypothetical protein VIT45_01025 [Allosphingosinicella sp.]
MTTASQLEIEFVLGEAGWADLIIRDETQRHEINDISYLSDVLDDLIRLGIDVATNRGFAFAQFFHEPGSTILVAESRCSDDGALKAGRRLSAVEGSELGGGPPNWHRVLELERKFIVELDSGDEIAQAILAAAERVERDVGIENYSKQWNGRLGFPSRAVAALRAALNTPGSSIENWSV